MLYSLSKNGGLWKTSCSRSNFYWTLSDGCNIWIFKKNSDIPESEKSEDKISKVGSHKDTGMTRWIIMGKKVGRFLSEIQ